MTAKLPPVTPYMTLAEAADFLQMRGVDRVRRLQRYLLARERHTGQTILVRAGGQKNGVRYRITLTLLRQHCPELFSRRDETVQLVRQQLEGYDERFAELMARDEALAREVRQNREDIRKIREFVERIEAISRRESPRLAKNLP